MKENILWLRHNEVVEFIKSIPKERDRLIFSLIYAYGLRVSEFINLMLGDIDIKNKTIKIRPLKRKSRTKHVFPLSDKLKKIIINWLQDRPKTNDKHFMVCRHVKNGRVSYGAMSRTNIFKLFRRYCKLVGISEDHQHPHVLRHSYAVACAMKGIDLYSVKELLRHARVSSTEAYYDITNLERDRRTTEAHRKLGL